MINMLKNSNDTEADEVNRTLSLLGGLFEFIHNFYQKNGLELLINITDPSLDDLLATLNEIDKELPVHNSNAKQAVLLAVGLINSLKCVNIDDDAFRAQIRSIINTNIYKQEGI